MNKSKIYSDFSELLIRKFESKATIKTYLSCGYHFIYDSHPDTIEKLPLDTELPEIFPVTLNPLENAPLT